MKREPSEKVQIRIVAGDLRGRKIACVVTPTLRPTPQMVREAFFSILGDAIPARPFIDIFAGTGVIGIEALSRGAKHATLLERDFQLASQIERYLKEFDVVDHGTVLRADVYRWAERWFPLAEPVNIFISPPFADLKNRLDQFLAMVRTLQDKVAVGSVITVQAELGFNEEALTGEGWERRQYGRNLLFVWVKLPAQEPLAA
jgi:16S rRNA (guanine966-N2)-methyltransferase